MPGFFLREMSGALRLPDLLGDLSAGASMLRLFLDQDSGLRAAALGAFAERVADRTADAFSVRINKDMTVEERRWALQG